MFTKLNTLNPQIFQRVEFWIILFFVLRLAFVMNPPLERNHGWRQATGLMGGSLEIAATSISAV